MIYKVEREKEEEVGGGFGIGSIGWIVLMGMEGKGEMGEGGMGKG